MYLRPLWWCELSLRRSCATRAQITSLLSSIWTTTKLGFATNVTKLCWKVSRFRSRVSAHHYIAGFSLRVGSRPKKRHARKMKFVWHTEASWPWIQTAGAWGRSEKPGSHRPWFRPQLSESEKPLEPRVKRAATPPRPDKQPPARFVSEKPDVASVLWQTSTKMSREEVLNRARRHWCRNQTRPWRSFTANRPSSRWWRGSRAGGGSASPRSFGRRCWRRSVTNTTGKLGRNPYHKEPADVTSEGQITFPPVSLFPQVEGAEEGRQMSGYLRCKKGNKGWKRMWFVLKDRVLYTYKASSVSCLARTKFFLFCFVFVFLELWS